MAYLHTLTPETTPTDRHIHGVSGCSFRGAALSESGERHLVQIDLVRRGLGKEGVVVDDSSFDLLASSGRRARGDRGASREGKSQGGRQPRGMEEAGFTPQWK